MGVQLSRYLARPSQPIRVEWAFGNITFSLRYHRHLDVNIRYSTAPTLELEGEDREEKRMGAIISVTFAKIVYTSSSRGKIDNDNNDVKQNGTISKLRVHASTHGTTAGKRRML